MSMGESVSPTSSGQNTGRDASTERPSRRLPLMRLTLALSILAAAGVALPGCKKGSQSEAQGPAQVMAPAADSKTSLLRNATFGDGGSLPWLTSFSAPAKGATDVKDGAL